MKDIYDFYWKVPGLLSYHCNCLGERIHNVNIHSLYTSALSIWHFNLPAMDGKINQHVCIKFCVKLSKSATDTLEILCKTCHKVCSPHS